MKQQPVLSQKNIVNLRIKWAKNILSSLCSLYWAILRKENTFERVFLEFIFQRLWLLNLNLLSSIFADSFEEDFRLATTEWHSWCFVPSPESKWVAWRFKPTHYQQTTVTSTIAWLWQIFSKFLLFIYYYLDFALRILSQRNVIYHPWYCQFLILFFTLTIWTAIHLKKVGKYKKLICKMVIFPLKYFNNSKKKLWKKRYAENSNYNWRVFVKLKYGWIYPLENVLVQWAQQKVSLLWLKVCLNNHQHQLDIVPNNWTFYALLW